MLPVEILPVQDTVILRARGSELLILPQHVRALKDLTKPKDFSHYFREEALINRPARKLFEAWLRKDQTVWPRLYTMIHKEMDLSAIPEGDSEEPAPKAKAAKKEKDAEPKAAKASKADEKPAKKKADDEKPAKAVAKKKDDEKPAKKKADDEKPAKAVAKKKDDEKPAKAKAAAPAKKADAKAKDKKAADKPKKKKS